MNHFDSAANTWDSEEKISSVLKLAEKTKAKLSPRENLDILDFGCGTGLYGLAFLDQAKSITGIDNSEGMIKVFNEKTENDPQVKSIQVDLEKENVSDKYDLIISSMTFHHLKNPEEMILKFKSMLKPHGEMAIVDLEKEDGSFHPDNKSMGVNHHGFSTEELTSWGKVANLKVEISTINTINKNDREYHQFLAVYRN
tara:strand:- start:224772 stop:225365 length:594 start_codon:yes stop_codon:yes gene_type:complete